MDHGRQQIVYKQAVSTITI
ncbi:RNA chaperone Hfq [Bacillus sp. 17RED48]|nr:RNA chaperone Hfq [Bacillus sp. 17RED48]